MDYYTWLPQRVTGLPQEVTATEGVTGLVQRVTATAHVVFARNAMTRLPRSARNTSRESPKTLLAALTALWIDGCLRTR